MRRCWPLALLALAACGDDDPCADIAGTCLVVRVDAVSSHDIDQIDQLELDVLYGGAHGTTTTQADGGGVIALPVATAIELDVSTPGPLAVGVVAAGKLGGLVVGTGAASATLEPGEHGSIAIHLGPTVACVAGSMYCGGDKVAGDPETLYECNGGGVPLARGVCVHGCRTDPADDDFCSGGPDTCIEGGFYCGGDKVEGDPQTLYRCAGGVGTTPMACANGCVVAPPEMDDYCR